ncbi:MAG TPA: amidohydrolase family protein [Terriglobales bacterium]|nr:amidohydrolase family protein [Terriglobales bacterium]
MKISPEAAKLRSREANTSPEAAKPRSCGAQTDRLMGSFNLGTRFLLFIALFFASTLLLAQSSRGKTKILTARVESPGPIAIRGAKLLTITHGVIENGVLVMENGKITAIGGAGTAIPRGAQVIDASGMTVYPGLIDSETNLGLTEIEAVRASNDIVEPTEEIFPNMHVFDAFHAETERIPVTRFNGVTNAIVAPGSADSIPGQDIFIQLAGKDRDEMVMLRDNALPLNMNGSQRRRGGRGIEGAHFPSTRMGVAEQVRQAFLDAQDYEARQQAAAKSGKGEPFKRDLKMEALLPYLHGQRPVVIGAEEPTDLETAMSIAHEFNLKVILNHVTHAQEILDEVASWHVPVVFGPIYDFPKPNERYDAVYSMPAELAKRGVKLAFASYRVENNRNLPYEAGYAVAFGLPYDDALKSVTLNAAEIWGVADKLGSLDVGKLGNVVIANGDPLDVKTTVKQVFIDGREIPMENRQTRLRDQYGGVPPEPAPAH